MNKIIRRRPHIPKDQLLSIFGDESISILLQQIFASRKIVSSSELERSLKGLLRPQHLKGITEAVALLVEAFQQRQRLLIVGDFDADGATSSTLGVLALRAMGVADVSYLVPNRFEFGYGLTPEIVEVAKGFEPDLIITVDNGISSIEGVAAAKAAGIKVLVTDHHLPGDELPNADAIVNPNQPGCEFPSKNLAGVGVTFYLMSALRSALREINWFTEQNIPEPNMANYLDLVALGTVADVVPLDSNNRILVQQGLQRIRAGQARPGILAMLEVAGRQPHRIVASDLGFSIGPRLNAAGRLDDISLGIECLLTDDTVKARQIASELDDLNKDRRAIESGMQQEALKSLEQLDLDRSELGQIDNMPWGLCLFNPDWHQGVIGILASRIKDKYHRPVIAFARADGSSGEIKGSARSIPGLHIRDALDLVAKQNPGLLSKFGGHAMAAGMSFEESDFERFQTAFDQVVRELLPPEALQAEVLSDGELQPEQFNLSLGHELREAGPWGQMFPEPLFDGEFYLVQQRIVGEKHLKLVVSPDINGQTIVDAIAFNVDISIWPNNKTEKVRLAYKLDVNEFRGRESVQLMVEYIEAI